MLTPCEWRLSASRSGASLDLPVVTLWLMNHSDCSLPLYLLVVFEGIDGVRNSDNLPDLSHTLSGFRKRNL